MSDILYAFWDFHAGTPPLDLPLFLAAAERARRQGGHDRCHVVLCDRSGGGAGGEGPWDGRWDGEAEWRLWNEVIPTLWLLPSGQCFSLCRDAGEVADLAALAGADTFPVPQGGAELSAFHDCRTGLVQARELAETPLPAPLRATLQARDYVRQWLERRNDGRMVVTLSTAAALEGGDGTDGWAREWAAFAARLDRDRILPVLLPAAADAHRPPGPVWEAVPLYAEAAWNAELRLALYEMSDLLLVEDPFGAGLALFGAETRCAAFGDTADRLADLLPAVFTEEAVRRPFPGSCDAGTLAAAYERMAGTLALPPLRPGSP